MILEMLTPNVSSLCLTEVKNDFVKAFEQKTKSIELMADENQENIIEEAEQYTNYTKVKLKNLMDSYLVFNYFDEFHDFRCLKLRKLNALQAINGLPIYASKKKFIEEFKKTDVLIIKSTAGSGKSTQLPQYLLECSRDQPASDNILDPSSNLPPISGRVLVTQPRVIAAESVAKRVQEEVAACGLPKEVVGYISGPKFQVKQGITEIVYLTEHEFMLQLMKDFENFLNSFSVFLIDEAHELRKTTMILLSVLKKFLMKANKLRPGAHKLLITSATLDTKIFIDYFEELNPQIIEAITPTYEVKEYYTIFPDLSTNMVENTIAHLKQIFEHIMKNFETSNLVPNILVFLPSIREIKEVKETIEQDIDRSFDQLYKLLPFNLEELHGGLKPSEKDIVLKPPSETKSQVRIILATKIAETAITLDDIYYVLDSGKEVNYFFDEIAQMDYNKEEDISKSSAIQRKGRAGRVGNGYCFKMYSQEEEEQFKDTATPEILRMDISDVIMSQVELSSFFKINELMYFEKLKPELINQVTAELKRLDAFRDENNKLVLTNKGKFMIKSGLKGLVGSFLYECLAMGNKELGLIATSALHNQKSIFRKIVSYTYSRISFENSVKTELPTLTTKSD